jgi:hypothetical protein
MRSWFDTIELDSVAEEGVRNSQPEGIGRVAALEGLVCWNNLGRNLVFADRRLRPLAVFGTTLFPDHDEPSQYDLDVHAVLDVPELDAVIVLNHLGLVRVFRLDDLWRAGGGLVEPWLVWSFLADVERSVAVSGRLVASPPRSEGAEGLLVSAPLGTQGQEGHIPTERCAEELGEVTALAVVPSPSGALVAVGGDGHVTLAPLAGDRLAEPRWQTGLGFRVASIAWHHDTLWAAGPQRGRPADDYDWDRLTGGGYAVLDPVNGALLARGALPADVAWGTGGVAAWPMGDALVAAGRTGRLHLVDPARPGADCGTDGWAPASLGIAHLAVIEQRVLVGYNRGGYRLHLFAHSGPAA